MAKLFVKKDGGFRYLGEGKFYTKRQLKLNELNNDLSASLDNTSATNVSQAVTQAKKTFATHSQVGSATIGGDDAKSGQNGENPTLKIGSNSTPEEQANVQKAVDNSNGNIDLEVTNSQNNNQSTLEEMRRNAIPFTKAELNKFLRTI